MVRIYLFDPAASFVARLISLARPPSHVHPEGVDDGLDGLPLGAVRLIELRGVRRRHDHVDVPPRGHLVGVHEGPPLDAEAVSRHRRVLDLVSLVRRAELVGALVQGLPGRHLVLVDLDPLAPHEGSLGIEDRGPEEGLGHRRQSLALRQPRFQNVQAIAVALIDVGDPAEELVELQPVRGKLEGDAHRAVGGGRSNHRVVAPEQVLEGAAPSEARAHSRIAPVEPGGDPRIDLLLDLDGDPVRELGPRRGRR
mmetsp:Transcript_23460/g.55552  ORF Transcript_23460/g.55552 Transcript_23460/m.55552 type:complete len:253 (-) Transcript_23460:197-955(-)